MEAYEWNCTNLQPPIHQNINGYKLPWERIVYTVYFIFPIMIKPQPNRWMYLLMLIHIMMDFNLAQDNVTARFDSSVGVMDRRSFSSPGARCRSKRRQLWRWRAYRWDKRTLHMCCTFPESHLMFWLLPQVTSADEHFQHLKSTEKYNKNLNNEVFNERLGHSLF